MAEFIKIETQEQFDAAITKRLASEKATIEGKYSGYLSPEEAAKRMQRWLFSWRYCTSVY